MASDPFADPPGIEIAITVITRDDPILLGGDTVIVDALRKAGFKATVVETDWANDVEWAWLTAGMGARLFISGRHHTNSPHMDPEREYTLHRVSGTWMRQYEDGDRAYQERAVFA